MSDLLALAARCEKATGPDRELDRDIIFGIYPKDRVATFDGVKHISTMTGRNGEPWFLPLADRDDCPHFTASIDAAMTLVPDGSVWTIEERSAWVRMLDSRAKAGVRESQSFSQTTPLAICAAALRAQESLMPEDDGAKS